MMECQIEFGPHEHTDAADEAKCEEMVYIMKNGYDCGPEMMY